MVARYVLADLWRNPRRTLSTMIGVTPGVGLFCGVLFFVDGLSAWMTQRAVAALTTDVQRVVSGRIATGVELLETITPTDQAGSSTVTLTIVNRGEFDARSRRSSRRPPRRLESAPT